MDQQDSGKDKGVALPKDTADTWAAVRIDVHEKTKHETASHAEQESRQSHRRVGPTLLVPSPS